MKHSGYIVFGHGSSLESANDAVRAVAAEMARSAGYNAVETAFLEGGKPDLRGAIDLLAARGIDHVVVLPYFLTLGMHLQRDLPKLVKEILLVYPEMQIHVAPPLDGHPGMLEALLGRARDAAKQTDASPTP